MHEHGPNSLEGPVRGSPAWWRGLQSAGPEDRPARTTKNSTKIRTALVARVRKEIAAGTYDTPEKWEAALDRMLERLSD